MILYNGCSHVEGDELYNPAKENFSFHLSRNLNKDYENIAERGSSNARVLRTTVEYIKNNNSKVDLCIIGLPDPWRFEYYNGEKWVNQNFLERYNKSIFKSSVLNRNPSFLAEEVFDIVSKLIYTFNYYDIKYFIFSSRKQFESVYHAMSIAKRVYSTDRKLYWEINKHFPDFFTNIAWKNYKKMNSDYGGFKPRAHPDEVAHLKWSSYLYNKITTLYGDTLH